MILYYPMKIPNPAMIPGRIGGLARAGAHLLANGFLHSQQSLSFQLLRLNGVFKYVGYVVGEG